MKNKNSLKHFVNALMGLIIAGIFIDAIFKGIPETGTFAFVIKLLKLMSPGVEDVAKLFLDLIYAGIYTYFKINS